MKKPTWIPQSEKTLLDSPVIRVLQKECTHSEDSSREHRFYVLESRDWCNIIPITDQGEVVLIEQFRIGTNEWTLELPGGVVDPTDPDLGTAALRELLEETGYSGQNAKSLGWAHPNPAVFTNRVHTFVVGPVTKTQEPDLDPGELLSTRLVPIEEVEGLLKSGEIRHALIRNAFLHLMLEHPGKDLAQALRSYTP